MKDLDDFGKEMESHFGLISSMMVCGLHELATVAGSQWDMMDDDTIDIPVNKHNASEIYGWCKEIRSNGYSIGLSKKLMAEVKKARLQAHLFLVEEANSPDTKIERKIELVRLCSKS
jgi:hypothetical protein